MKRGLYFGGLMAIVALTVFSCKKSDNTVISTPEKQVGQTITSDTLKGSVKGTMTSGKTYYFSSQVTVNAGDTLLMQSGVKLLSLSPNAQIDRKRCIYFIGYQGQTKLDYRERCL